MEVEIEVEVLVEMLVEVKNSKVLHQRFENNMNRYFREKRQKI